MTKEMEKLTDRYYNEKNPEEKKHLKREMDQTPLSSGELERAQQREVDRQAADIESFHKRKRS